MQAFSMEELFPLIEEGIARKGKYRFYPRGVSMQPLLYAGDDSVELSAVGDINKYDMLLYQRDDGSFVLHRVVAVRGELIDFCGDGQCFVEKDIRRDQIKAGVYAFYKGERRVEVTDKKYLRYAKRRVATIPLRRAKTIAAAVLKRLFSAKNSD